MEKVIVEKSLDADADLVWGVIGAVGGVDEWSPVITSCRIDTKTGGGLKRICTSEKGELIEEILKLDTEKRILRYAITQQPFLPVSNVVSTIQVHPSKSGTKISTTVDFLPNKGANIIEIEAALNQIYSMSYEGIETLLNNHHTPQT